MQLRPSIASSLGLLAHAPGLAFALTYLGHSLVCALAVALLMRARHWAWATRHALWKAALFGPLLSAVLACTVTGIFEHPEVGAPALGQDFARAAPTMTSASPAARTALVALCFGAALLGGLRLTGAIIQTRRRLRTRRAASDGPLLARVELLRKRMGLPSVNVSQTDQVTSPLVIGAAELCLPSATLSTLSEAEVDAVLAHELAHIERGDGLWFPAASALACVLWLNPVNAWLSARFRASAEFACDDRAVELTGNRLNLARALLHLASTTAFARRLSFLPSILHSQHALVRRVQRLTTEAPPTATLASRGERLWVFVLVSALGALLSTLGVRLAAARSEQQAELALGRRPNMLATPALGLAEESQSMGELARQEQRVAARLVAIEQLRGAAKGSAPRATLELELQQQLRHIHATELWLEQRLASAQR